jgi:hypothetical protein
MGDFGIILLAADDSAVALVAVDLFFCRGSRGCRRFRKRGSDSSSDWVIEAVHISL